MTKTKQLIWDVIILWAVCLGMALALDSCAPKPITKEQLREVIITTTDSRIVLHPGDLTLEEALQLADSIHQVEIIRFEYIIDSLTRVLDNKHGEN